MKEALMENTPLFSVLTEEQRTTIAERMTLESRRAGDLVYQQGRPATALFLIKSGWARLVTDQLAVLANVSVGSLMGEADVVAGRNYSTSAEAATDLSLWVLNASDLRGIMAAHPEIARKLKQSLGLDESQALERHLRRMELFAGLTSSQLREVAEHLQPQRFTAGETIYRLSTEGDNMYLVDQGRVQVSGVAGVSRIAGDGQIFGEGAFLTGEPHSTEAVALSDTIGWSLARADFEALVMHFPSLALNLSRVLSRRLRENNLHAAPTVQVMTAPAGRPASQPQPAAVTGALVGLNRAADTTTSWFGSLSAGAKFRLVAVILLLVWLVFVTGAYVIRSVVSQADTVNVSNNIARASFRDRAVLVALAADLPVDVTPTYTPWPTETPIPTPTFTPTATPTNTPIPTATFTPTPAPPTATPAPTRVPVRAVARQAAPAQAAAAVAAAPAKPSVQFKLVEMRRLSACENRGMHNIFIKVMDGAGNPVDGITLVQSPNGQPGNVLDKAVSGSKGPGKAEFIMWKGAEYAVYVSADGANPTSTDIAKPVHSNFTDEELCGDGGGGNTLFHNSFSLVFQKTF